MNFGRFGMRTFGQKLRVLIVAVPLLVLIGTSIVGYISTKGWSHGAELERLLAETRDAGKDLDAFFRRIAVIPQCIAARQTALPNPSVPDANTVGILDVMLKSPAASDCYGLYMAFDGIDPRVRPEGMQWVDRQAIPLKMGYDHNEKGTLSQWYHGAIEQWKDDEARKTPLNERAHYVSEPTFDEGSSDKLVVSVTQVVFDRAGEQFIGVAGVDLYCDQLKKFINDITSDLNQGKPKNLDSRIITYLLSRDDKVIARTDAATMGTSPDSFMTVDGCREGLKEISRTKEGQPIVTRGRVHRRLFSTLAGKSGWKVVLSIPEAEIDAAINQSVLRSTMLGSIAPAIMVLIAWSLAGYLTGPIPRLTEAVEAVEGGDYRGLGLDPVAARKDEFGQLARGFRRMVAEVSTREVELKQAQESILSRERHFRSLIENGSDVIAVLDHQGVIRYESPSIQRVLGYAPEELVGTPRFTHIHPDDVPIVADAFDRRVRGVVAIEQTLEYRFRHKDGSWRTLEASSTNLTDDPAVGGIVVNSRDITERKKAQAELDDLRRRHADELEGRVRIRTAELAQKNEELKSANEATDQAMKLQEVFLSNVAHDLRTPLTIVIGYSEDLLRRARKKGQDAFIPDLKLIVSKGKDLLELINDLLNLSKAMNEKGVELDLVRFDVAAMIRSRMEGISAISQKQANTIDLILPEDLGAMFADESKVWRILMNLLTNACKFTRNGKITLAAERLAASDGGDRLRFRVTDTGMGMSPEQTSKLFDRFAQVHASSGKMQAGVGLGLSICQLYCRSMGGTIGVSSEPGVGTVFEVELPAEVLEKPTSPPPPTRASRPGPGPETSTPANPGDPSADPASLVLIIDDDASVCELIRRNLGEQGIESRAANTGEEGLRLAKQLLPSAIILDILMPGIDGWAVLAALKTDSELTEIPVIMASMLDEKERGLRMGADEYVAKPFGPDRLADLIRKHLRGRESGTILSIASHGEEGVALADSLREQGWQVVEATDGRLALEELRDQPPDLVLIDLMVPDDGGMSLLAQVRGNDSWKAVPIIVVTAAGLDPEARRRLQGQVEKIFTTGVFGRDDLIREVRSLVARHRREDSAASAAASSSTVSGTEQVHV